MKLITIAAGLIFCTTTSAQTKPKASCVAGCSTPSVCFNRAAVNQNFSGQSTRERSRWLAVKKSKFANSQEQAIHHPAGDCVATGACKIILCKVITK
jgi:hypothetical protein